MIRNANYDNLTEINIEYIIYGEGKTIWKGK